MLSRPWKSAAPKTGRQIAGPALIAWPGRKPSDVAPESAAMDSLAAATRPPEKVGRTPGKRFMPWQTM